MKKLNCRFYRDGLTNVIVGATRLRCLLPALAVVWLGSFTGRADTVLNNLAQTVFTGGAENTIGAGNVDAQAFTTGPNVTGYLFNSVSLLMSNATGSPNLPITVAVFNNGANVPGAELTGGLLTGLASPTTTGLDTYSPEGTLGLLANTTYWIVANSASTPGEYVWSYTGSSTFTAADAFTIPGEGGLTGNTWAISTDSGDVWSDTGQGFPNLFSLDATLQPVPEPSTLALLGLGAIGLLVRKLRR